MRIRHAIGLSVAITLALLGASSSIASAAVTTQPSQASAGHYCTTLIHRDPTTKKSSIASQTCSSDRSSATLAAPLGSALLATFFEDAGYVGYYDSVYGDAGPCDSSGYGFTDMSGLEYSVNGISSYYYYNNCNAQQLYTDTYYGGIRSNVLYDDRFYVGDTWNDNIYSMRLWNG